MHLRVLVLSDYLHVVEQTIISSLKNLVTSPISSLHFNKSDQQIELKAFPVTDIKISFHSNNSKTKPEIVKQDLEKRKFADPFDIVLLDDKWGKAEKAGQEILLESVYCHVHGPENTRPLIVLHTRHWNTEHLDSFFQHIHDNRNLDPNRFVPCQKEDAGQFQQILFRVLATKQLKKEKQKTQAALEGVCGYKIETLPKWCFTGNEECPSIIGHSFPMRIIFAKIMEAASCSSPVIITGETGTGKELVAQAIHYNSTRRNQEFYALNCATIPETLAGSELFGHEEGTFTGATEKRIGMFEAVNGGTLFLDEIGDLPKAIQAMFLRVLQEKKFRRVGGNKEIKSDFRLIAATNKDLRCLAQEGLFQTDLLCRLDDIHINLPPLRARGEEDFRALLEYFINKNSNKPDRGYEPAILTEIMDHQWSGNVREFEHCIQRMLRRSNGGKIELVHLGDIENDGIIRNPRRNHENPPGNHDKTEKVHPPGLNRFDLFIKSKVIRNEAELSGQILNILNELPEDQSITDEELTQILNITKKQVTQTCSLLRRKMENANIGWTIQKGTHRRLVQNKR